MQKNFLKMLRIPQVTNIYVFDLGVLTTHLPITTPLNHVTLISKTLRLSGITYVQSEPSEAVTASVTPRLSMSECSAQGC